MMLPGVGAQPQPQDQVQQDRIRNQAQRLDSDLLFIIPLLSETFLKPKSVS